MKKSSNQKSSERYSKPSSQGPIRHSLPVGLFSTQYSLFSSVLSTKNKKESDSKSQKRKISPNYLDSRTQRAETPNSLNNQHGISSSYHLRNLAQKAKKKNNLLSMESNQQKITNLIVQNKSMDFNSVSSRVKENAEFETSTILDNLKQINQQMNSQVFSQLSQQIVLGWQKQLVQNCENIIQLNRSKKNNDLNQSQNLKRDVLPTSQSESSVVFEKLLADERRNRLLVEEQTSKLIQSQELQIQAYIEKIKILEQKLLEKPKRV